MEIAGKVAVITGAGSGIGRACARHMAERGAAVLVADIDEGGGRETVAGITAMGGKAEFVPVDVSRLDDLVAMFEAATALFGGFDILCNNAGLVCGQPLWPDTDPRLLLTQVAVNLGAVIVGTRLAIEPLRARGGGVVVNTASLGALLPLEDEPGYSATKAGVVMFTRACAALHTTHNVRVYAVLPGLVDTPLLAKSGDGSTEAPWARQARQILPLLSPTDVAEAVVEMISDDTLAGAYRIVGDLPDFVSEMI
ncbi:MAG TPA: SDR family oxidoreductase [Acidimicrobiales bacterium]|jgi:NAD(P)-dependent dehydrogenase (short-subunit alcohol dehydrogenase family)